jgi:formate dehydrogenase iron-sulfur subunit
MTYLAPEENRTLIDELLAEQQRLTAVERFSRRHDSEQIPAQNKIYRDLIPLTVPAAGQQYAFEVDLDKCSGCKACVSACHSMNGLDETETWRDAGLIFSDDWREPYQQTITTACHHCVEPACLEGCPVLAYDKDPLTGIVRHLDDQCIGCQYCVMKCPYDVPKYSKKRGIVRKCDMCANRLRAGEAPACVQACPSEAIRITIVKRETIMSDFRVRGASFLSAAPDPTYTLPTTRYKSSRPMPAKLLAGDHAVIARAESHMPLVIMLVLTQLSVGINIAGIFVRDAKWVTVVSFAVGALALGIASLHLGKPMKAWRAFLGWRKSWFSREVIAFGIYSGVMALTAASFWISFLAPVQKTTAIASAMFGLVGVACSAMIYVDTRREFWSASQTFVKFFGTTLLLGLAASVAMSPTTWALVAGLVLATIFKLAFEHRIFRHLVDADTVSLSSLNKTARLLDAELGLQARARIAFGIFGGVILPIAVATNKDARLALIALMLCVVGEILERFLFFTAVVPLKMPGGVGKDRS